MNDEIIQSKINSGNKRIPEGLKLYVLEWKEISDLGARKKTSCLQTWVFSRDLLHCFLQPWLPLRRRHCVGGLCGDLEGP